MDYYIEYRNLSVSEYQRLRNSTNWSMLEDSLVKEALLKNIFSVCISNKSGIIGSGRIIGDGIYLYIQDVIVMPQFRGLGFGKIVMNELMEYLKDHRQKGQFIGLMAAAGVQKLYEQYGFQKRPDNGPGMQLI